MNRSTTIEGRLVDPYRHLIMELFGTTTVNAPKETVGKEHYRQVLKATEEKFNIKQDDPDYSAWVMMLIMRSPKLKEQEAKENG